MRHVDSEAIAPAQRKEQEKISMGPQRITEIAALAWEATKPAEDPSFNQCILDHRLNLITRAQSVKDHGLVESIGPAPEFEKKVAELLETPPPEKSDTKKEAPQSVTESAEGKTDVSNDYAN